MSGGAPPLEQPAGTKEIAPARGTASRRVVSHRRPKRLKLRDRIRHFLVRLRQFLQDLAKLVGASVFRPFRCFSSAQTKLSNPIRFGAGLPHSRETIAA
jgi:hypothetical protein